MSALSREADRPFAITGWQPDVVQLLDEHHLVAWSDVARRRLHFAVGLAQFLQGLRETEVCSFYGGSIHSIDEFCHQLERAIPGPPLERRIDGPRGVTALLRSRETFPGRPATKFRFYIWHDADILLQRNRVLFGRLVDAFSGIGAEAEYANDDLLLIHRAVFVGGPLLNLYADDTKGQFQVWFSDGHSEPFWQVVSGLPKPPFMRCSIDSLMK